MSKQAASQKGQPIPIQSQTGPFLFPAEHHLVITTEQHVLSYDGGGLHKIFSSGTSGILAAKEARDGSETLAIADSQVVLLHREERGLEKSYRLKGTEGQIRLLEFTPDSKSLYFTTTLLNAVQCYSLHSDRLLEPGPTHHSPPTVLALSTSSHILLSGSESPPTVYLQHLKSRRQPVYLQPHASQTPVVCASFHPELPDVFLLAFKNGTLAFYDATQIMTTGPQALTKSYVEGLEIGFFHFLHSVVSYATDESAGATERLRNQSITGAAFLPGYKSRAVSVGADGKCRIVDFAQNRIVRTWHVKGSATAVSILSKNTATRTTSRLARVQTGVPSLIIAVSRLDGRILLYDSFGKILDEQTVDGNGGRVIDVEWIKGPGPKAVGESNPAQFLSPIRIDLFEKDGIRRTRHTSTTNQQHLPNKTRPESGDRNPRSLGSDGTPEDPSVGSVYSQDTGGPMLEDVSTIRHYEVNGPVQRQIFKIYANNYMDLFSPAKDPGRGPSPRKPSPKRRTTPRPRPRLSSSTFVDQSSPYKVPGSGSIKPVAEDFMMSGALPPPHLQTRVAEPVAEKVLALPTKLKPPRQPSRRSSTRIIRDPGSTKGPLYSSDNMSSSRSDLNSKLPVDIRRFREMDTGTSNPKEGNPALFAPYMPTQSTKTALRARSLRAKSESDGKHSSATKTTFVKQRTQRPERPKQGDTATDDNWLTVSSETDENNQQKPARSRRRQREQEATLKGSRLQSAGGKNTKLEDEVQPELRQESEKTTSAPETTLSSPENRRPSIRLRLGSPRASTHPALTRPQTLVSPSSATRHRIAPSLSPQDTEDESLDTATTSGQYESDEYSTPSGRRDGAAVPPPSSQAALELPLPPGFAQSYQGPVDVGSYLPRKGSLAFVPSSDKWKRVRTAFGAVSGKHQRRNTVGRRRRMRNGIGVADHDGRREEECEDCAELKIEVERLKEELAELKRFMKGKGKSRVG